jgi:hypothetical protein
MSTSEKPANPKRPHGIIATPQSGRARRRALAAEAEAERLQVAAEIAADWPEKPTATELVVIGEIAAHVVRLRRLRADGRFREADEVSGKLARAVRTLGWPLASAPAQTPITAAERILIELEGRGRD